MDNSYRVTDEYIEILLKYGDELKIALEEQDLNEIFILSSVLAGYINALKFRKEKDE